MSSLRRGDKGAAVVLIQGILHRLGYEIDEVDGIYGKQTQAAVEEFQTVTEIESDGIVGTNTANALVSEIWALEDPSDDFEFDEESYEDGEV